jgi:hypothetical protein
MGWDVSVRRKCALDGLQKQSVVVKLHPVIVSQGSFVRIFVTASSLDVHGAIKIFAQFRMTVHPFEQIGNPALASLQKHALVDTLHSRSHQFERGRCPMSFARRADGLLSAARDCSRTIHRVSAVFVLRFVSRFLPAVRSAHSMFSCRWGKLSVKNRRRKMLGTLKSENSKWTLWIRDFQYSPSFRQKQSIG